MTAYSIISSTSHALTGTSYSLTLDSTQTQLVRVWADVNFHIRMDGVAATTGDMPVTDHHDGILLNVPSGGTISVVKKSGEPDGTVWFSHVKRV
jgi:hypothetical protein